MEDYELVEIRRGGVWIVGVLGNRTDNEILFYVDSFESYIPV